MQQNKQHHQLSASDHGGGDATDFFDDVNLSADNSQHRTNGSQDRRKRSPHRKRNNKSISPKREKVPADMTVICNRVDLFDCASKQHYHEGSDDELHHSQLPQPNLPVSPYHFAPDVAEWTQQTTVASPVSNQTVAVVRAPRHAVKMTPSQQFVPEHDVIDTSIPNPHAPNVVHDKYWAQRRRLFSRFDMGIQLDAEGWYSVTPEVVADHVAQRIGDLSYSSAFQRGMPGSMVTDTTGIIVLDAFCGCGGNAIAFGKLPIEQVSLVVCVDIDRTKLRMAAYNACLYDIPHEKLIFVECSSLLILEHCYKDGVLCIDHLRDSGATLPTSTETEVCAGFFIGGIGMLPPRIDAVFMDPPWGGVDYNSLGKNGYCLEKHMKIKLCPNQNLAPPPSEEGAKQSVGDDFFDSFGGNTALNVRQAKKKFNQKDDESAYWNGVDLLKVAASATRSRLVVYDLPRNTSKISLGKCALAAGYRGNLKLEEHYLNGRLKTITAYMGADYSSILCVESERFT
jgi:trimethylguanosine synthase